MECNKEDAFRAKEIAERKMQEKDFVGAHKFAIKAQRLYPDTENISQMISVCDVHCSAENKIFGNESDWYGILQIEQTADDTLIKKQYRKFALLLHPDKNKFAGAEAAFKLIGEAQRVLLDREKRSYYDMKRRTSCKPVVPHQPPHQANRTFSVAKNSRACNNFSSNPNSFVRASNPPYQEQKQPTHAGVANGVETFWTLCPFCAVKYQYYKEVLNRALRCQSCKKPFVAYDMEGRSGRPGFDSTQPVFPRQNINVPVFPQQNIPNAAASKAGSDAKNEVPACNSGFQAGQKAEFCRPQTARELQKSASKVGRQGEQGSKSSIKINGQRGKKHAEDSSESFESDSSLDSDEIDNLRAHQSDIDRQTRRSNRNKRHVSYNENASDDEESLRPSKKEKGSASSCPETEGKTEAPKIVDSASREGRKGECIESDRRETVAGSTKKSSAAENGVNPSPEKTPEFHEYPDPEFCDFDKNKEERCFKVGQIWAAYDTVDAMPRFYARIKKISPGFKLQITWLEPDPDDERGREWADLELPFPCGKFKKGVTENTEDRLMFSHLVSWSKGGRDCIMIYPRKGETWALFKNWNANWGNVPEGERKFEYEFVEIVSDYDENAGIQVAPLAKLKGFASLFCQRSGNKTRISPAEVLRFSHLVPSWKLTGNERVDVPSGSFELDPASITMNLEEITLPRPGNNCVDDFSSKFAEVDPSVKIPRNSTSRDSEKGNKVVFGNSVKGAVTGQNIPDPEFHNFDAMKSEDKFQMDQVWALYDDDDGLPKYYGYVKKIDPHPVFKVHIAWLEACSPPTDMIVWKEKGMPISCGQFKIKSGKCQIYDDVSSFSHQLRIKETGRKNLFTIYPRKGEVWALHKNWNVDMKVLDLTCEYDIVEVLEDASCMKVLLLERVHGFNSVFKPLKKRDILVIREIPRNELLRFSHQIPCFRLTNEAGGSLRGFWELDPAAFPCS